MPNAPLPEPIQGFLDSVRALLEDADEKNEAITRANDLGEALGARVEIVSNTAVAAARNTEDLAAAITYLWRQVESRTEQLSDELRELAGARDRPLQRIAYDRAIAVTALRFIVATRGNSSASLDVAASLLREIDRHWAS